MKINKQINFIIVTPSYNQEAFLKQTIDSVVQQKGNFTIQYCIMDGGSTDDSLKLLKQLPTNIYWESKTDEGQTHAINKGIEYFFSQKDLASSETVFAFLNSDDFYLPGALQTVAEIFSENSKLHWLVGDSLIVNSFNEEIQIPVRWYKRFWRSIYQPWFLLILNPIPQPSTFLRWSSVKQIGQFNQELQFVMDYEFWLRMQKKFGPPNLIEKPLAAFRIHSESKGGSQFFSQFREEVVVASKFTSSKMLLIMHQIHNLIITTIYRMIK